MTKAELRTAIQQRLAEVQGGVVWSVAEIDAAIDETYDALADQCEWCERTITVDLLSDRPYYDLRTVVPEPVLTVGPAYHETTGQWLTPASVRDLDGADRRWEGVVGTAQRIVTRGLWWLGVTPRVRGDVGTVRLKYTTLPDRLTDLDEPGFPEPFHEALVEGPLCDLWAQDGETARAEAAWQRYLTLETGLQQWVNDRAAIPMRHGYGVTL
jgi:hypothetical protein